MSQPPPYVRFQDYSDYQIAHQLPGAALAGADMDAEFDRIKTTFDALLTNIALIQRDDGAIKNLVVTPDSISSALAIMIANWTIRGAWLTATAYALKDYVTSGASGYVCVVAHTSGVFATDLAAGKWVLVQTKGDQGIQGIQGIQGVAGSSGTSLGGFLNRAVNGDFALDQRKEGGTHTYNTVNSYGPDAWYANATGANVTGARIAGLSGHQYAYRITGANSNTGVTFGHRIESLDVADLVNGNVTVQVWLSSNAITSLTWTTKFALTGVDDWSVGGGVVINTGTITITPTPTLYTFTTNVGVNAGRGIAVEFSHGALVAAQTITYEAFQLERGSVANQFDLLPIELRLSRARRRYCKSYVIGTAPAAVTSLGIVGGTLFVSGVAASSRPVPFPVPMRATPATFSIWDAAGTTNVASRISTAGGTTFINGVAYTQANFNLNANGFLMGYGATDGTYFTHYTADAEL
jgi:hypothetical protein